MRSPKFRNAAVILTTLNYVGPEHGRAADPRCATFNGLRILNAATCDYPQPQRLGNVSVLHTIDSERSKPMGRRIGHSGASPHQRNGRHATLAIGYRLLAIRPLRGDAQWPQYRDRHRRGNQVQHDHDREHHDPALGCFMEPRR
jgi:hypothetical protein